MPAAGAIIDKPMLVDSYSAINSGHKIRMAVLAEFFLNFRRHFYLVFHCYSSGQFDVFV